MSSTVSFNRWTLPSLGFAESVGPQLTWPLAGSLVFHVVVMCVAIMGVYFLPAVESPEASYHVALVTLPEHRPPPTPTSRVAEPRVPATLPERRSPRVVPPAPSVQKPETRVGATALPRQSEPSFSHAAVPLKTPQLATIEPVSQKRETPVRRATEASPTPESLTRMIDSVQIPKIKKPRQATMVSESTPQAPETVPHNTEDTMRERPPRAGIVVPPPPSLASVSVGQETMPLQQILPVTTSKSERVRHEHAFDDLAIPAVNETQTMPTELLADGASPEESSYWEDIWVRIDPKFVVPPARLHDRSLRVVLAFRVERTGQVSGLTIERSSGNDAYDLIAKRAVIAASPFPPFPPTITEDSRKVHYTFTFPQR